MRSGIAITAGLGLGLTCSAAARFSCLLAVPGTAMARVYDLLKLLSADEAVEWQTMSLGPDDELGAHVSLEGVCNGHAVWFRILSHPPRRFAAGRNLHIHSLRLEDVW